MGDSFSDVPQRMTGAQSREMQVSSLFDSMNIKHGFEK